jgi:hypothetical protein
LHQTEQPHAALGDIGPLEDRHGRLEAEVRVRRVEDEQRTSGIPPQPIGADAVAPAAAPDLAVHERDADANGLGHAPVADRDHRCGAMLLQEGELAVGQIHRLRV